MKRSKLVIVSVILLSLLGLRAAMRFPAILVESNASGASASFSSGHIMGAALGSLIWFFLAVIQWRGNGRWALGIGIFSAVSLLVQSGLFFLAINSGRIQLDAADYVSFLFFTVIVFGALVFINLKLHVTRKHNSG